MTWDDIWSGVFTNVISDIILIALTVIIGTIGIIILKEIMSGKEKESDRRNLQIIASIVFLLIVFFIWHVTSGSSHENDSESPKVVSPEVMTKDRASTLDAGVCYYDWKGTFVSELNYKYSRAAPQGYNYYIVKLYIENHSSKSISSNPTYWKILADGIEYNRDFASYSYNTTGYESEIVNGGHKEITIVYCVEGKPSDAKLVYDHPTPKVERITHY